MAALEQTHSYGIPAKFEFGIWARREKVFMDWNFGNCKVEWKMRLWISSRGNWRQTGRARTMEDEHRRRNARCRVPSGRWRQCAEQESEETAYTPHG